MEWCVTMCSSLDMYGRFGSICRLRIRAVIASVAVLGSFETVCTCLPHMASFRKDGKLYGFSSSSSSSFSSSSSSCSSSPFSSSYTFYLFFLFFFLFFLFFLLLPLLTLLLLLHFRSHYSPARTLAFLMNLSQSTLYFDLFFHFLIFHLLMHVCTQFYHLLLGHSLSLRP